MTIFRTSSSSQPQSVTGCDAARKLEALISRSQRVPITPEWQEENRQKQAAYEQQRRKWQEQLSRAEE